MPSLHTSLNKQVSDLCRLQFNELRVTAAEHLRSWFLDQPHRKLLISSRALDVLAGRPLGTFSRFLAGEKYMTFERITLAQYYPFLRLLGYVPPTDTAEGSNVAPGA